MRLYMRWLLLIGLSVSVSSAWAVDKANWMWELYHDRGDTRIRDMVIPATHDSGTYNITGSSAVAPDAGDVWTQLGYSLGAPVVARWSKTQTRNLSQQLEGGIRYLDFRIKKDSHGQFVFVHGLVGDTLPNMLQQVKDWAQAHPKELVFVGLEKLPDTTQQQDEMDQLVQQYLGHILLPNHYTPANLRLSDVWSENRNVIVLGNGHLAAKGHWWDYGQNFQSVYGDSTSAATIHAAALNGRGGNQIGLNGQDLNKWHNISITTTPDANTIGTGVFDDIVQFFSGKYTPDDLGDLTDTIRYAVAEWVPDFIRQGKKVNFVSVDFFEDMAVVETAIAMNWRDVPAPGGQLTIKATNQYDYVWHDGGSGADEDSSIWKPKTNGFTSYRALGHVAHRSHSYPGFSTYLVDTASAPANAVVAPTGYGWVWHDRGSGADRDASVWAPIAPKGYTCLGHVGYHLHETPPSVDEVRCVHDSYLSGARHNDRIWNDHNSGGYWDTGWWAVHPWNMTGDRWTHLFLANRNKWANTMPYIPKVLKDSATTLDAGYQEMRDGEWGKCLTVKNNQIFPDQDVIMHSCNGGANQKWKYESATGYLRSGMDPNYCLGNFGQPWEGGNVNVFNCIDHDNVRWDWKGKVLVSRANPAVVVHPPCGDDYCSVVQYRAHGGRNQDWSYAGDKGTNADGAVAFRPLKAKGTNACLTIYHNKVANHQNVIMYGCNGGKNQEWKYDAKTGRLHSALDPNYCLDSMGHTHDGGNLVIHQCVDHPNLKFDWTGDVLRIRNNSHFVMDASCYNNGCNVHGWSFHGGNNQRWEWAGASGDEISLKNKENGRCIAVHGTVQNWAPVDLSVCDGSDRNQRWVDLGDGMMRSAVNQNMCVDIAHGQLVDQAQLVMWPCHGQANQLWRYNPVTGHITTLMNQNWAIKGHAAQDAIMRGIEPGFVDQTWTLIRH